MEAQGGKPRILIVDDAPHIRELVKLFYDEYDLELLEGKNGREAVDMARAFSPDMILLDMQMPVMNGYEATVILKNDKSVKNIPLVVMTGQAHSEVTERISGLYDGYLSKPFLQEDLISATREQLSVELNKIPAAA